MKTKKAIIIFSGFNQRAVISFLRTLKKHKVCFAVIAKSKDDTIFLTEYKEYVTAVRASVSLILEDILSSINETKKKIRVDEYIIAPSTEALNRFILKYTTEILDLGCAIPLVNEEIYEKISDKEKFTHICEKSGILVPKRIFDIQKIDFPVVAKPLKYTSELGKIYSPVLIFNDTEFNDFKQKYNLDDFFFQEFVEGESFYLLYYFHKDGKIFKFSQENIVQQPDGKSIVAAVSSDFHEGAESIRYEELFKNLGFRGLVMVEVKHSGEKKHMIEANPRFWGPSQLFIDAQMDFFQVFLHDYELVDSLPSFKEPSKKVKYFWFGGVNVTYKLGKSLTFHKADEETFLNSLPSWLESDIYRRPDTLNIFKNEMIWNK